MRSNPAHQLFFIFRLENFLRSNLNSSTSYGRLIDCKSFSGLLLVRFLCLGEKISLAYLLIGGEDVCPPMPKRFRHRLCADWLKIIFEDSHQLR